MLPTPTVFALVSSSAEGRHKLSAFDAALLGAGVGDVNLLRVSSILPPGARRRDRIELPPGALVPIAYGTIQADQPGKQIAAAVAVGIGAPGEPGVIVEHAMEGTGSEAEAVVRELIEELFARRNRTPRDIFVRSAEHRVERVGCAFAGVVLWYGT